MPRAHFSIPLYRSLLLTMKSLDTLGTLMILMLYVTTLHMTIFRKMFSIQLYWYPHLSIHGKFRFPKIQVFQLLLPGSKWEGLAGCLWSLCLTCFSFGVWEAAKWVARVRERTVYDSKRPILLNLTTDIVEENRYLQCKESALETAFLIKAMES